MRRLLNSAPARRVRRAVVTGSRSCLPVLLSMLAALLAYLILDVVQRDWDFGDAMRHDLREVPVLTLLRLIRRGVGRDAGGLGAGGSLVRGCRPRRPRHRWPRLRRPHQAGAPPRADSSLGLRLPLPARLPRRDGGSQVRRTAGGRSSRPRGCGRVGCCGSCPGATLDRDLGRTRADGCETWSFASRCSPWRSPT